MNTLTVKIDNPNELNLIFGMTHFIKSVEDIHEIMVTTVPGIKFGLAFSEASQERLIRTTGTDPDLLAGFDPELIAIEIKTRTKHFKPA